MPSRQLNRKSRETTESFGAPGRGRAWILHLLMFGSGGLALVYEILWMRRFAAVFGATTPAVAATLAAVFFGFTAGSLFFGALAVRVKRPVRGYGLLEFGAGVGALLVEPFLNLYDHAYPALYHSLGGSAAGFAAVKTLLAGAALFLPSFCMGGTVPLLGHGFAERWRLGISAGGLYAANTFGAAIGALSVPFLLLPKFGAQTSYAGCIGGSWLIAAIACWLDPGQRDLPWLSAPERKTPTGRVERPIISPRVLALLAALSGGLLFILQVVWSRMFAQVHENSIYSFSLVLAVLLAGLAGGAAVARQWLRLGRKPERLLALAWIAAGVMVCVAPHLFYRLTNGLSYIKGNGGWGSYGLRIFSLSIPTVLLPTLLAGMVLPLLMEMAGQAGDRPSGGVLGWLIGSNTIGAIGGALLAAFVLPSTLGLWGSLVFVGLSMIVAGVFCFGAAVQRRTFGPAQLILYAVIVTGFLFWNPASPPRTRLHPEQGEKLLDLKEDSHGVVAVVEKGGSRRIKLNNYYVLGGSASTGDERVQGHLPLLLHPNPKRVAFLGIGTGITAGAALLHPVERVTAIELVPEVVAAARQHFAEANLGVLESPRTEVVVEDARNFLRASVRQFDVIVGDLVVPWRSGEAALYTADHFATVRRALAPKGIFCQWLPMFQLSEMEFNIVAATFLDVFPSTTLWRGDFAPDQPALALIGQLDETPIDPVAVEHRLRELKIDPANPNLTHPAGLWIFLAGPLDPKEERFIGARRNRENQPWLEILGPLNHAGSARGGVPLFVGRPLESFLTQVRACPLAGTSLAKLNDLHLQWREAGAKLGTASLLTYEGRDREADALLKQAVSMLPLEIRSAFDRPAPP